MVPFDGPSRTAAAGLYGKKMRELCSGSKPVIVIDEPEEPKRSEEAMDLDFTGFDAPKLSSLEDESARSSIPFAHFTVARFTRESPVVLHPSFLVDDDRVRGVSLKWWRDKSSQYPRTAELALRYLCIQPTESDV